MKAPVRAIGSQQTHGGAIRILSGVPATRPLAAGQTVGSPSGAKTLVCGPFSAELPSLRVEPRWPAMLTGPGPLRAPDDRVTEREIASLGVPGSPQETFYAGLFGLVLD